MEFFFFFPFFCVCKVRTTVIGQEAIYYCQDPSSICILLLPQFCVNETGLP